MSILNTFDKSKPLFTPLAFYKKIKVNSKICLCTFSKNVFEYAINKYKAKKLGVVSTAGGDLPFYLVKYRKKNILLFNLFMGGPAASGLIEELSNITNIKNFVVFGSCGVLRPDLVGSKIIVPSKAYRDEGTSYHYKKYNSDFLNVKNYKLVKDCFTKNKIPYIIGKTWTTDAIYRETINNVKRRRKEGCICVEMECASLEASLDFYNKNLFMFFYSGDTFDGEKWNQSIMCCSKEKDASLNAFNVALILCDYLIK